MSRARIKVAINGRFLLEKHPTGTHRSALGFTKALIAIDSLEVEIHTNVGQLSDSMKEQLSGAQLVHAPWQGRKLTNHLWEQLVFPNIAPDAVHFYPLNTGPFIFSKPNQILTIHDIYVLTSKGLYSRPFVLWNTLACGVAARRSRRIVCFTEFVRNDITSRLKIPSANIAVVPQGPGLDLNATPLVPSQLPEKYFLCVGGLQPHKNLRTVILAFAQSDLANQGYQLLVIGKRQANFAAVNLPDDLLNAPWLIFTGYVEDGELISYYQKAAAFVYISLLEGFGLPLVESFNLECPVITSNVSCLPEVAGGAALLVDPLDVGAVSDAMRRLVADTALRSDLLAKGRERALDYTWKKAGEMLAREIAQVADIHPTPILEVA